MRVAVLGAGAWGCTLATLLHDRGHAVALWEFDRGAAERLARERWHAYLGLRLPDGVLVTCELDAAVATRELIVLVTPSEFARATLAAAAPALAAGAILVCAAKGLEGGTRLTLDRVIAEVLPGVPFALLSGPTFAKEIAAGLPAAVVVAAHDTAVAREVQAACSSRRLRVYTTDDVIGVAVGGTLKNVIAIAVGVSDGLGLGSNARAALITRGLSEMGRLALRLGAHPLTLSGLAGLGDLVLTCTGDLSRNRQVGLAIARGESVADAVRRLGQVAEGIESARSAAALALQLGVDMPITTNVAGLLHGGKPARDAMDEILSRDARAERD
jgi:glycerol-3-phosphate dehydrogenase (NAD(P)+)